MVQKPVKMIFFGGLDQICEHLSGRFYIFSTKLKGTNTGLRPSGRIFLDIINKKKLTL